MPFWAKARRHCLARKVWAGFHLLLDPLMRWTSAGTNCPNIHATMYIRVFWHLHTLSNVQQIFTTSLYLLSEQELDSYTQINIFICWVMVCKRGRSSQGEQDRVPVLVYSVNSIDVLLVMSTQCTQHFIMCSMFVSDFLFDNVFFFLVIDTWLAESMLIMTL
jgi:hypothetical protein